MRSTVTDVTALYHVRKGEFAIVDVPELGYVMVDGEGAPEDGAFAAAVQALYTVSYGAHFAIKKEDGQAPRVMPLEAQWWVTDPAQQAIIEAAPAGAGFIDGEAFMTGTDRHAWRWRAMIMQPERIGPGIVERSIAEARAKKKLPALDRLRYQRWEEGICAQVLHLGPYAEEGPSVTWLHQGIAAAGYRACGRHHEIYLGDPRRADPQRLHTILRQPIEPLPD